jgi:hypothetical protein
MHDFTRAQNVSGVCKPTQQPYGLCSTVRHVRLDTVTENTLQQILILLANGDQVSIGLLMKRALNLYGAMLTSNPHSIDREREAVRRGARLANKGDK